MYLLIAGSRQATPAMLEYTSRAVERALKLGYFLLAGDALGVDKQVAESVRDLFNHDDPLMFGMRCYGLEKQPRHGVTFPEMSYVRCQGGWRQSWGSSRNGRHAYASAVWVTVNNYMQRDELMCREAHAGLFVWNGESRGTLTGFRYMCTLSKPAWLVAERDGQVKIISFSGVELNEPETS